MPFKADQIKALEANLDASKVAQRDKAGRKLSYIEGWHALAEANRIFGHDGWDRITALTKLGEPEKVGDNWHARFMATVTIRVRAGGDIIERQGVGYGSGIARNVGDSYEGAIKEAETDATKRALATFGWPFGLALYDKSGEHVGAEEAPAPPPRPASVPKAVTPAPSRPLKGAIVLRAELMAFKDAAAIGAWWTKHKDDLAALTQVQFDDLKVEAQDRKRELANKVSA